MHRQNRFSAFLTTLTAVLLAFLAGGLVSCGPSQGPGEGETIQAYYINREETKIVPVEYVLTRDDTEGKVQEALDALQEDPSEFSLRPTVSGFQLVGWQLAEGQLSIDFNSAYRLLSPTTEVLVRAALVRTATQIQGVDYVMMTVEGEALTDSLGGAVGPMTADLFLDNPGAEMSAYEMTQMNLYFANEAGDGLLTVQTDPVVYNSNISVERLVVDQLIAGPAEGSGAYPALPPETTVLGVTTLDGTCYVNFGDNFLAPLAGVTADVTIYSIVNSLTELPNVYRVQIAVNGKTDPVFRETFPLTNTYERNLNLVGQAEEGP